MESRDWSSDVCSSDLDPPPPTSLSLSLSSPSLHQSLPLPHQQTTHDLTNLCRTKTRKPSLPHHTTHQPHFSLFLSHKHQPSLLFVPHDHRRSSYNTTSVAGAFNAPSHLSQPTLLTKPTHSVHYINQPPLPLFPVSSSPKPITPRSQQPTITTHDFLPSTVGITITHSRLSLSPP